MKKILTFLTLALFSAFTFMAQASTSIETSYTDTKAFTQPTLLYETNDQAVDADLTSDTTRTSGGETKYALSGDNYALPGTAYAQLTGRPDTNGYRWRNKPAFYEPVAQAHSFRQWFSDH